MTTTPSIDTVSSIARIASTAAWSAAFLSPRPTQRPAPIAAASVTRTSSSARFRSGTEALLAICRDRNVRLHPLGRLDPDQVEAPRDHPLRGADEREPEPVRDAVLEHAVLVVEA